MNTRKIMAFAIGPIGAAIISLISLPIITWFYSVEDVGRISLLMVVISFGILFFSLGLDQAYVREFHEVDDKNILLKSTLYPGCLLLIATLVSTFIIKPHLLSKLLFQIENSTYSILIIVCMLTAFLSRFLSLILRMNEKGIAYSMSQLLPKAIFLIVVVFFVYVIHQKKFFSLILAQTISISFVLLILLFNARKYLKGFFLVHINQSKLMTMLKFGLPLVLGGLAYWGLTAIDKIMIRSLSTLTELGIYSVAVSFASAATILQSIFSTIWAPTVYKWASSSEGLDIKQLQKITAYIHLIVIVLFVISGIGSWILPLVLPKTYDELQYLVPICMTFPLMYTLSETTVVGLGIMRKSNLAMLASCFAFIINFILAYFLIPRFGATGAAISTAIAFWIFFIFRTEFSCSVWVRIPRYFYYVSTLFCIITAIFIMICKFNFLITSCIWLCIGLILILISVYQIKYKQ